MEEKIKIFLEKETGNKIDLKVDLIKTGAVDSFSMIRLISFLETEFGVKLNLEDISSENFNSIDLMVKFIKKIKNGNSPN